MKILWPCCDCPSDQEQCEQRGNSTLLILYYIIYFCSLHNFWIVANDLSRLARKRGWPCDLPTS